MGSRRITDASKRQHAANAEFIATFDPPMVLALLDVAEAAERSLTAPDVELVEALARSDALAEALDLAGTDVNEVKPWTYHEPGDCTYVCPATGDEVLAYRDERHVVVDADRWRALLDAVEAARRVVSAGFDIADDHALRDALDRLREVTP
jgi:hypothetical protein